MENKSLSVTQKQVPNFQISLQVSEVVCFLSFQTTVTNFKRGSLFLSIQIPQSEFYLQVLVDTQPPVVLSLYVIFKLLYIPQWNTLRPQPPPLWSNLLGFFNHTLFFKGAEIVRLFLIKFGSWIFSLWRRCPGVVDPDPAGRVSGSAGSGLGHPFSKHSSREWHWSNLVWQKCLKHIDLSYFPYL